MVNELLIQTKSPFQEDRSTKISNTIIRESRLSNQSCSRIKNEFDPSSAEKFYNDTVVEYYKCLGFSTCPGNLENFLPSKN